MPPFILQGGSVGRLGQAPKPLRLSVAPEPGALQELDVGYNLGRPVSGLVQLAGILTYTLGKVGSAAALAGHDAGELLNDFTGVKVPGLCRVNVCRDLDLSGSLVKQDGNPVESPSLKNINKRLENVWRRIGEDVNDLPGLICALQVGGKLVIGLPLKL